MFNGTDLASLQGARVRTGKEMWSFVEFQHTWWWTLPGDNARTSAQEKMFLEISPTIKLSLFAKQMHEPQRWSRNAKKQFLGNFFCIASWSVASKWALLLQFSIWHTPWWEWSILLTQGESVSVSLARCLAQRPVRVSTQQSSSHTEPDQWHVEMSARSRWLMATVQAPHGAISPKRGKGWRGFWELKGAKSLRNIERLL